MDVFLAVKVGEVPYQVTTNQWKEKEAVGKGQYGQVFKFSASIQKQQQQQQQQQGSAAVTVQLASKLARDEDADERIVAEIQAMKFIGQVAHPSFLPLLLEKDFLEEKRKGFVTLFVPSSLRDIIKSRDYRKEGPGEHVIPICCGLFRGVAHLDRHGRAHRDIKPENLLVDVGDGKKGGVGVKVYLADLDSVAKVEEKQPADQLVGTAGHQSPETALCAQKLTTASDLFSCGSTIASLLLEADLFRIEGEDGGRAQSQRRRVLDSMAVVLGKIPSEALREIDVQVAEEDMPKKLPSEETSLKNRIGKSRLPGDQIKFFQALLQQCLDYVPSRRIKAFAGFKLLFAQATKEQQEAMEPLIEEEKAAADEACGGRDNAKKFFRGIYKW